ncbi:hypothetical protein TNCV_1531611 [Trichonephila clavipes]|nr:hypothetical protein TNCV_1531611 [Trichonephila clavipes]
MNCQTKLRVNHLTAVKPVAILESNANFNFCTWKNNTLYDRGQNEKREDYTKEIEVYRDRAEERRLERKQELELARIEARHKEEIEARPRAEEEAKAVEERRKK